MYFHLIEIRAVKLYVKFHESYSPKVFENLMKKFYSATVGISDMAPLKETIAKISVESDSRKEIHNTRMILFSFHFLYA